MSGTTVSLKPVVYKSGDTWFAELDHGSWTEYTQFNTWGRALDHALWLGLCAGVWDVDGSD